LRERGGGRGNKQQGKRDPTHRAKLLHNLELGFIAVPRFAGFA